MVTTRPDDETGHDGVRPHDQGMRGQVGTEGREQALQTDGHEQPEAETDHRADETHEHGLEQHRPQHLTSRSAEGPEQALTRAFAGP